MTIVTAITGGKDILKEDFDFSKGRFVAFTDLKSEKWETFTPCDLFHDPVRNAKIHKVLIHKYIKDDISIWIDGSSSFHVPADVLVDEFLKDADIFFFTHAWRDCVYKEASSAKGSEKHPHMIDFQMEKYKFDGYPEHNGLLEGGFIIRRHNERTEKFNNEWWTEICTGSRRDQLSIPYVLWKNPDIKVKSHISNVREHPYFYYKEHLYCVS